MTVASTVPPTPPLSITSDTIVSAARQLIPDAVSNKKVSDVIVTAVVGVLTDNQTTPYISELRNGVMCTGSNTVTCNYCEFQYNTIGATYAGIIRETPVKSGFFSLSMRLVASNAP
jgi:hypothetical protein